MPTAAQRRAPHRPPAERGPERALWGVIYAVLVLAPVAFLLAAPASEDSDDVFLAVVLGFVAITVMALQVVIASRASVVTASFGIDRLLRVHRVAGLAVVVLVGAHVVAVVGAEDDYASWLHPLAAPTAGRLGQAAVLVLVLLTVTVLARRALRIPYEVWRGLHTAFAVGVLGLAFAHVIAVGRFTSTGTIRWVTLGFVVLALVGVFHLRVVRPFLAVRRPYRLAELTHEPDGSLTLQLEADGHAGAGFVPGQFAWLKHAGAPYALTEHPFSYASSAHDPARPSFTVKPVGDFTSALAELPAGAHLLVDGPHGAPALPDGRDGVLVAGGSGITPAMSVLRTAADEGAPRRLLLVCFLRDADAAPFGEELERLARSDRVEVVLVPSRPPEGWHGPSGRVSRELLDEVLPRDRERWSYFVCGPPGMTDTAEAALRELGIAQTAVRVERFALA